MIIFRWVKRNINSFILAFFLAGVVWVSAIMSADPIEEGEFPNPIPLNTLGQESNLIILEEIPRTIKVSLRAPKSIWKKLENQPNTIAAWIDLTNLAAGKHKLPILVQASIRPNQVIRIEPDSIDLTLEPAVVRQMPVILSLSGEPALGYRRGSVTIDPTEISVSGPESIMNQVLKINAELDISGANETITRFILPQAIDQNGNVVRSVTMIPEAVSVTQVLNLLGGFRNVVVKVVTNGQLTEGYWLTNISVIPPNVTVFSEDPALVENLAGYVETEPVILTNLSQDSDNRVTLKLPKGVDLAGEESVLVKLDIEAVEGSLPISLPVEFIGLPPSLKAQASPDQVDVLISGPLPLLNNLKPGNIRIAVDLTGLKLGTTKLQPVVDLIPDQLKVASINPEFVSVTISNNPLQTPIVVTTPIPTP